MTKPKEIPQDVWNAAVECAGELGHSGMSSIVPPIARAIFAERERCAKVAEATAEAAKECQAECSKELRVYHMMYADIATQIAADIRAPMVWVDAKRSVK